MTGWIDIKALNLGRKHGKVSRLFQIKVGRFLTFWRNCRPQEAIFNDGVAFQKLLSSWNLYSIYISVLLSLLQLTTPHPVVYFFRLHSIPGNVPVHSAWELADSVFLTYFRMSQDALYYLQISQVTFFG